MLKWVLFDWRNTLANSDLAVKKADEKQLNLKILTSFGFTITKKEFIAARKIVDLNRKTIFKGNIKRHRKGAFFKDLLGVLGKQITWKHAEAMEDKYVREYDKLVTLMPGAIHTLTYLKKQKVNISIISNTRKERLISQINQTSAVNFVDLIITSVESKGEKSSLQPFSNFLQKINKIKPAKPSECIMIGDRADEDLHAKSIGFTTILFGKNTNRYTTEIAPDFIARDFKEVKKILATHFNS